jgi:hypothetical protein
MAVSDDQSVGTNPSVGETDSVDGTAKVDGAATEGATGSADSAATGEGTDTGGEAASGKSAEELAQEGALSPDVMLSEPHLTEADFETFIDLFTYIIFGTDRLDFVAYSKTSGVSLRRLNYITAKIMMPLGEPSRREVMVNELGLGVLMDAQERALFLKYKPRLDKLAQAMEQALSW